MGRLGIAMIICLAGSIALAEHLDSTPQEVFDSMRGSSNRRRRKEFTLVINGT
jgi:hypothetical protein